MKTISLHWSLDDLVGINLGAIDGSASSAMVMSFMAMVLLVAVYALIDA